MPARLKVVSVLTVVALGTLTPSALASPAEKLDNPAIATDPQPGGSITTTPVAVTVVLDGPARTPAAMTLRRADGTEIVRGTPDIVSTNMILSLPNSTADAPPHLTDGVYEVLFRSETSHGPEGGSYQFVVGPGAVQYQGIRTWGGYEDIPKSLALPGDAEREARAKASPTPTADPEGSGSTTPGSDASTTTRNQDDGDPWWPWAAGGLALAIAALVALRIVVVRRGRRAA